MFFFWIFTFQQKYCITISFWYQTCNIPLCFHWQLRFVHDNKFIFIFLLADNQTKQKMHLHLAQALLGKEFYPAQRVYQVYWNLIHQPTAFHSIQPKSHLKSTQQMKMISQAQSKCPVLLKTVQKQTNKKCIQLTSIGEFNFVSLKIYLNHLHFLKWQVDYYWMCDRIHRFNFDFRRYLAV